MTTIQHEVVSREAWTAGACALARLSNPSPSQLSPSTDCAAACCSGVSGV